MIHDRDFFTPDDVDRQVDQLAQHSVRDHLPADKQATELSQAENSLIEELKQYYRFERQEDYISIERAWERISFKLSRDPEITQAITKPLSTPSRKLQGRLLIVQHHIFKTTRRGHFARGLGLLVAVLVAALLVGSLVAVLNLSRQQNTTTVGLNRQATHAPTATSTPAPVPGKVLYTTPISHSDFKSLSWSPDSKRIASATNDTKGIQFWDATTGDHLVTVQLPGGTSEWAWGLSWSPNSQEVAIATNLHLLLVNGLTGAVINSNLADAPTASNITSSDQTRFSSLFAASGGFGYRAIAWSPDGHLLAAGLSSSINGEVQIWNPQTGATEFTVQVGATDNIGALAWSSDGHYLAADTWNTQGTGLNQPSNKIVTWNVSTHQVVFQHSDSMDSDAPITWQPRTHNLAFFGVTASGNNQVATLEIWDATTGKLVTQYVGVGHGALAWSPDGTDLAYAGYSVKDALNAVIIMDIAIGKQIFVYKEHNQSISVIAWSPDGKYIVSTNGKVVPSANPIPQLQVVAEVWTA